MVWAVENTARSAAGRTARSWVSNAAIWLGVSATVWSVDRMATCTVVSATIWPLVRFGIWAGVRAAIWLVLSAATCVVVSAAT